MSAVVLEILAATDHPDGTREQWTATTYTRLSATGQILEQHPIGLEDLLRIQRLSNARTARQQINDGVEALEDAATVAEADIPVAHQLRDAVLAIKVDTDAAKVTSDARRQIVSAWTPQATYTPADLILIRDEIVSLLVQRSELLTLLGTILQAFADGYDYRAANDGDAALGHRMTAGLANIVAGGIDG